MEIGLRGKKFEKCSETIRRHQEGPKKKKSLQNECGPWIVAKKWGEWFVGVTNNGFQFATIFYTYNN